MELLVVVMIIISLTALGSIGLRSAMRSAAEAKARQTCRDLAMAIENFRLDHNGNLPIDSYPDGDGDLGLRTDESNSLMKILTNRERGLDRINQKGRAYFSAKEVKSKDDGLYISPDGESVGLYDPWKGAYYVVLDTNFDEEIKDPTEPGSQPLRKKVLVFSAGDDMKIGKDFNDDNIYSWK